MTNATPTILIAPLNWGLGHATRCIPLINALLVRGIQPILASDGRALALLQAEYPNLQCLKLPGYQITYDGANMIWSIGKQLPKIVNAIWAEHREIKKIVAENKVDIIISDNRYGVYNSRTHNVFMTHQLNIKIPSQPLEKLVNLINHHFIRRFHECWVPDFSTAPRLAGSLSGDAGLPSVKYLGPLSRMRIRSVEKKYDIIAVLSGPEPQRTILEKQLLSELKSSKYKALVVRGVTEVNPLFATALADIAVVDFLTTEALNEAILASEVVICRSGYSSIMDLMKLEKAAILIPTPGQTEQEYLGEYLSGKGDFVVAKQNDFNLEQSIRLLKKERRFAFERTENKSMEILLDELLS